MIGKIFLPMEEFIKYSSEKADEIMEMKLGEEYFTRYSFSDIDGNQCYTDEGQNIENFNLYNCKLETVLEADGQTEVTIEENSNE